MLLIEVAGKDRESVQGEVEGGGWGSSHKLTTFPIIKGRASHPILATKINVGIPVKEYFKVQTMPKGNENSLVRSLGTKKKKRIVLFVCLFVCF